MIIDSSVKERDPFRDAPPDLPPGDFDFDGIGGGGTLPGPAGEALIMRVMLFRMGFDAELLTVDRWKYEGWVERIDLPRCSLIASAPFFSIPDGLISLEVAEGEKLWWAESDDPAALVASMGYAGGGETRFEYVSGQRVTRTVLEPFARYLRAVILGPETGIRSRIRSLGDYKHPPATLAVGRLFVAKPGW